MEKNTLSKLQVVSIPGGIAPVGPSCWRQVGWMWQKRGHRPTQGEVHPTHTPWKINMEPKNGGLEDDFPFQLADC